MKNINDRNIYTNEALQSVRAVYVNGEIDETGVGQVIAELLKLDQISSDPVRLFIYSSGGEIQHVKHLCNLLLYELQSPIITIAVGYAESCATVLLACGNIRLAFQKATLKYHSVFEELTTDSIATQYTAENYEEAAKELRMDTKQFLALCVSRRKTHINPCIMTPRQLKRRIDKPRTDKKKEYMIGSRTALKFGFIDGIIQNARGIRRYERMLLRKQGKL